MQVAEIVPVSCLDMIADRKYHMCLAQLVLKNKEYADFYRRMADEGKYVILDNGAAEGESLSFEDLYKAYELIEPSEIILPDEMRNGERSFIKSLDFYLQYKDKIENIMVVPQGKDWTQWKKYARYILELFESEFFGDNKLTIGVPKWLGSDDAGNRLAICQWLNLFSVNIHLLGCSEGPEIMNLCSRSNYKVRGCDSAFAYIAAKEKMDHIDKNTRRPNGHIDFLNDSKIDNLSTLMSDFEKAVLA